jgi:L-ascorbate metabolism protein UlaG (beta-lactamase superfamily)
MDAAPDALVLLRPRRSRIRRAVTGLGAALVAFIAVGVGLGCCAFSAPGYQGPASDHFDGEVFFNQDRPESHGSLDAMRWQATRDQGSWKEWTDAAPGPPPAKRVARGDMRVTFINHASVLIQMDGLNILTDPVWSDVVGPISGVGPRRVRPPGVRFEDLPPIDVVLVSHNHYDHMDVPTLRRVIAAHKPRVFAGLGSRALLHDEGIEGIERVEDLDWWQVAEVAPEVRVTSVPAQHFSQRGLCDRDNTLWTGYVVSGPAGIAYFAGDTGFGRHFRQVRERFGKVRLAVLPIGAYRPRWFMATVHIDPEEAVKAHLELGATTSVGMHFGTFRLADDGQDEPVADLTRARSKAGVSDAQFWVLGFGEGRDVPPIAADTR